MSNIQKNYQNLLKKVKKINPNAQVCVVTKNQSLEKVLEAIKASTKIIGENRVQEAETKFSQIPSSIEKHLIGHLQKNKVKKAVQLFDVIQSVDSLRLAKKINQECKNLNKIMSIMLEVNTSEESQKHGFLPKEVIPETQEIAQLKNLQIIGLMTVAKYEPNPENCRPSFKKLKTLYKQIQALKLPNIKLEHLSMGMTNDYKIALEEGSTIVRVGTGIFSL
jgi:pyridoxal phosphate enzyme (YggS family)